MPKTYHSCQKILSYSHFVRNFNYDNIGIMILDSANYDNNYGEIILQEMSVSSDFARWTVELSGYGMFGRVIEIGCGLGNNLDALNDQFKDMWASDSNEAYLRTDPSENK